MKDLAKEQVQSIRVWTTVILRVILLLALLGVAAWLLYEASKVILLLILSVFFCYMIAPVVRLFEQPLYFRGREIRLPRGVAIILVYVVLGAILYIGFTLLSPVLSDQFRQLADNLPAYKNYLQKLYQDANTWFDHLKLPKEWRDRIVNNLSDRTEEVALWVPGVLGPALLNSLSYLLWLVIVPILSFFLLKDAETIERGIVALMPNERLQKRAHWLLLDVSRTLAAYIRAQITACVEVGALVTIGFVLIGTPYAVVFGLIAALLEFFPMIGPLMFAATSFAISLTVSFQVALAVAAFLAVLRITQDYIIYPRIVGHGVKMHPLVVILAVFAGIEIGGLVGVFLSIPVVALLIVFYNHYLAYRGLQSIRAPGEASEPKPQIASPGEPAAALEK